MNKKEARKLFGYTEDDQQSDLEDHLGDLAMNWRRTKDPKYVSEYHQVLSQLIELGWNDYLDADAQLPKELMPKLYFEHQRPKAVTET